MHSKQKGNIAEAAVAAELMRHDYSVFTELGDLSPVDLIGEKGGKLIKFQVKWGKMVNGVVKLDLRRCMSSKSYKYLAIYSEEEVDIFAIYIPDLDEIAWVPMKSMEGSTRLSIRCRPAKNNQRGNPLTQYQKQALDKFLTTPLS